jgi:hypothetical protein
MNSITSAVSAADLAVPRSGTDPRKFGVGARVTLAVMADDYADVILGALAQTDAAGLDVTTSDVSTHLAGSEADILRYLTQLIGASGRTGRHVSAAVQFSRGCPGEVACEVPAGAGPLGSAIPEVEPAGVSAVAEWALYPLDDGASNRTADHMRDIYAAIDYAKEAGTFAGSEHFVTRLTGDVADILRTAAAGWILVGRSVQHVTSHVTLSLNSPTTR